LRYWIELGFYLLLVRKTKCLVHRQKLSQKVAPRVNAILIRMSLFSKLQHRLQHRLSHYPTFYALIVGIGIVLFWRGVWHTADHLHLFIDTVLNDSMSLVGAQWWDGPLSLVVGSFVLYFTGAFTSSFIGNELILSGLRGEKKLTEKTESEVKNEVGAISEIQDELVVISTKLAELQKQVHKNHS